VDGESYEPDFEPASEPEPEPASRTPRQRRVRRRRRRRQLGTLLFVAVAGAILVIAYLAVSGDDDASDDARGTTPATAEVTSTTAPFAGTYQVTTGVNVREGAGTTFATVGVVEQGRDVVVACAVDGEVVAAPTGANPKWLKVTGEWSIGYVSAAFVTVGDDLRTNKIPACPPA